METSLIRTITKEYKRLAQENPFPDFKQHTYLITDSKGAAIRRVVPSIARFHIIDKSGVNAADKKFIKRVSEEIKDKDRPIVIIWFGTCELTRKSGKYLKLRESPFQNIEICLTECRKFKKRLLEANKSALIVFLECPYYSIKKYNKKTIAHTEPKVDKDNNNNTRSIKKKKGEENLTWTIKGDNIPKRKIEKGKSIKITVSFRRQKKTEPLYDTPILSQAVDYYNTQVRLINDTETPRLSRDIIRSHKTKRDKCTKYKKDYSLYHDGVHPIRPLAKLWMYRIVKLALELNDFCK